MARLVRLGICAAIILSAWGKVRAGFVPWDALDTAAAPNYETWIYYGAGDTKLTMHTANAGDYSVGFDQAKLDNSARGMNALKFVYGGAEAGHLASNDLAGSFAVRNGGDKVMTDLVLLVAIQAAARLGMSYRNLWGRLQAMEKRLGVRLLTRRTGGAGGGGMQLTPGARVLLAAYGRFRAGVDRCLARQSSALAKAVAPAAARRRSNRKSSIKNRKSRPPRA